jgi:hypothetical protein
MTLNEFAQRREKRAAKKTGCTRGRLKVLADPDRLART